MTRSLRIAIADDEPDMREYFQKILPRLGHQVVVVAESGRALYEQCLLRKPDLIISDIRMPDMDGIEAVQAVNRKYSVPVILVSAFHNSDLVARAEIDHVMAYLVKPIRQADLEPAIGLALRRFAQREKFRTAPAATHPGEAG